MNILFTSSGRRVELLKRAAKAVSKFGGGKIIAADFSSDAPTSRFCDVFEKVPSVLSPDYIPALCDICRRRKIDILIPTIDTELEIIAKFVREFEQLGVLVNISHVEVIRICRDKLLTQKFFEDNGIASPILIDNQLDSSKQKYPLFIKPRYGSSSINALRVNSPKELDFFREYIKDPIVQNFIFGDEYTVDVFCGFDSNPITIVPRLRIAVRSGEILKGRIVRDSHIISETANLVSKLKPFGHITVQCFKNDAGIFFVEVNPRFGGGAPMSIDAGANSIENLIRLKRGEKLSYSDDWRDGIEFSRFDDSVMV